MTPRYPPICYECRRFVGPGLSCEAYPEGIPDGVIDNIEDHTQPLPGDRGLFFVPINPAKIGARTGNPLLASVAKYRPDQARDERGRWTDDSAGGATDTTTALATIPTPQHQVGELFMQDWDPPPVKSAEEALRRSHQPHVTAEQVVAQFPGAAERFKEIRKTDGSG